MPLILFVSPVVYSPKPEVFNTSPICTHDFRLLGQCPLNNVMRTDLVFKSGIATSIPGDRGIGAWGLNK